MLRSLRAAGLAAIALVALGLGPGARAVARESAAKMDESALFYYASLGQKARVAAEERRLSRLDPDWRPPEDLYAAKPGAPGEGYLWSLLADDKFDGLRAAIATREAAEPGWRPSSEFVAKRDQRIARAAIIRFAAAHKWREIVETVKASGIAWAADDAEALWIVAEAHARQNDCAEAYIVYHDLLANHPDPKERTATIERAMATIPMEFTEKLIAMGHAGADGRSEFDAIGIDITRARISAFLHDEAAKPVSPIELAAFQTYVRDGGDPDQSGLVAWFAFKRGDYREALDWFKLSIAHGGDAMIAHGLAHSLRKLGLAREAEDVAYAWREPLVNNAILFVDILGEQMTKDPPPPIDSARIARYAQVVATTGSGEGAQALAWYAYNTCQLPLALEWFQRAVAWAPKEATVFGYALTLRRLKHAREFRDIVNRYDGLFPKVVALAFDEGRAGKPTPCEAPRTVVSASTPERAPPAGFVPAAYARARVPSPEASATASATPRGMIKTTEFPIAVAAENPLRFSALHTNASEDQAARDLARMPRVARRVPGVGAMPYERWGFTLMPGWDGTKEPSSPTAAERAPPAGTIAALAKALEDQAGDTDRATETGAREMARRHVREGGEL